MTFDDVVVLICAALWLLHLVRLLRVGVRRVWRSWLIASVGLGVTAAAWLLLRRGAWIASASALAGLLIVPALATRAASRAVRFGGYRRAKTLAWLSFVLRPVVAQRVFVRAVELSSRLARGEAVDVERAVESLGTQGELETVVQRLAFLSWSNDYATMTQIVADPEVRDFAVRSGMSAIVVAAVAETSDQAGLLELYRHLARVGVPTRRHLDSRWALLLVAAHLGDEALVAEHIASLSEEVPADRLAFLQATAQQRADRPQAAFETVDAALRARTLSESGRRRLMHRLEHPLPAARVAADRREVLADIAEHLHVQRALAPLGLGTRQRSPLTVATGLSIVATHLLHVGLVEQEQAFRNWGLIAPFDRAPDVFRLLSYAWLHLDGGHLTVNVLGLLVFGRFVESGFGRLRFLVIYLLGAVGGGLAYLAFESGFGVAIGASGAVLALFGATVAYLGGDARLRATSAGRRELAFLALIAFSQLAIDAVWAQSSGSAHGGGLAAGLLLGFALRRTSMRSA